MDNISAITSSSRLSLSDNYAATERLVPRWAAIGTCVIGLLELMCAIMLMICSFTLWGTFCNDLDCSDGLSDSVGFWLAFPMLAPAFLGVLMLATRESITGLVFTLVNIVIMIAAIAHIVVCVNNQDDYWRKWHNHNIDRECYSNIVERRLWCTCVEEAIGPFDCEMLSFGFHLNKMLVGLSICAAVILTLGIMFGGLAVLLAKKRK